MTIPEIIEALKYNNGKFPLEAVNEAIAQRKAITPELLRILEEDSKRIEIIDPDAEYMAHLFAMYLLSQFREPRAYPLLIDFFSQDQELVCRSSGDILADDMGRMLASTFNGDISLIKKIVEDESKDDFVRTSALSAMVVLFKEKVLSSDEVMGYIKELFNGRIKRDFNFLWTYMTAVSCDLYPGDMLPDIEKAFDDGLVDSSFIGDMDDVNQIMNKGEEKVLNSFMNNDENFFIYDTIKEMSGWICFKEDYYKRYDSADIIDSNEITNVKDPFATVSKKNVPVVIAPKVGKNDPCPCGSGEKYKRCCG